MQQWALEDQTVWAGGWLHIADFHGLAQRGERIGTLRNKFLRDVAFEAVSRMACMMRA
jgi:hypothetical protein